ncbi:MAG: prepilin-type N-terminal cleavage/methylation domain-containing protein [Candidatus Sumerlaeaceae bacterium]|nr:prepilin-type N-terminal cleavage/methylation domain-containing protein [Candidatus Sumerlaeaceae bacterium]
MKHSTHRLTGFTLLELLIAAAIVALLCAIALVNFQHAKGRANQARCAANLKAIAYALYAYKLDLNRYPLADGTAGLGESMGQTSPGNGPAANGSWDGVPRVLVRLGYLGSEQYLFCPTFRERFKGDRLQRFRYAYNNSAADTGGTIGAPNDVDRDAHDIWLARCLWVPPESSFTPQANDVTYPHGEDHDRENVLMSNSRVELRDGRQDFRKAFGISAN